MPSCRGYRRARIPPRHLAKGRYFGCTGKPAFAYYDTFYPLNPATYEGRDVRDVTDKARDYMPPDVDLFEEVAKFRALRRVWARTMKERFGATDPRAMRLRIACHTSGRSLTHQQPLNNLARATVQTLAALLGRDAPLSAFTSASISG